MIASREYVKDLIAKVFKLYTGEICAFMAKTAPRGFLACDGTEYNISDYRNLARFIYNQFGSYNYFGGDGETTFAVPDLRGEFLRGTGTNSHSESGNGAAVGVHQKGTIIPRISFASNTYYMYRDTTRATSTWGDVSMTDGNDNSDYLITSAASNVRYGSIGGVNTTSSSQPTLRTIRPTNTSVLYCIRC